MLIIGSILLIVIGVFIYNGFRTRCPNCGKYALHSKDTEAIIRQRQMNDISNKLGFNNAMNDLYKESRFSNELEQHYLDQQSSYASAIFRCNSCKHSFDRKTALIWLGTANKLGEEIALKEYKKIKSQ